MVDRGVGTIGGDAMQGLGSWAARRPWLGPWLERLRLLRGCSQVTLWALVAVGCGAELPEDALHEALAGWFRGEGIEIDGARCHHALPRERDATVECQVEVGLEEVDVTVVVTDDAGALLVRPRHATVVAAKAEPEIAQILRGQGLTVADVRCNGRVWVARPGAEQRCEVVDDAGRRYAWIGVWSGEGTRQRTRVVQLSGLGGAP